MHFPKDFPDKLRSSILVSEVVGKKVKLKLRGKEFQGLCPFHNEKSPSFTVNDQKGFFHCFGCQAHGDIIGFVMKNEGMEYGEAVEKLANDFSIPIPKILINQAQENRLEKDYLILEKINVFFENKLFSENGRQALIYLQKRGIAKNIIKKFRLGFAPNSYDELINFLKSENFSEQEISNSGIVGKNDKNQLYVKFRNRVIFPIFDKKNRVIAFGGRCLGDELPKYLNSAETNFFKKSQTLYNYSYARSAIFAKSCAVALEGYMDVISLFANGLENVVAGLGTALGEDHLKELFYITDKIIICLDGDQAGIRAAKRVSEISLPLISAKKNISFVFLPNKMDPDDFVKEFGAQKLEELFRQAIPLSESLFEFALMELEIDKNKKISAENKAKIEANLSKKIEVIKDNSSKKYFSQFFKDLLFQMGRGIKKDVEKKIFDQKFLAKTSHNFSDLIAKNLISLMIKHPELASFRDSYSDIREIEFCNENLSHLKELVIDLIDENEKKILARLENTGFNREIDDIKNIIISLEGSDFSANISRFRILLLKDLLLQVDAQYKDSLSKIDEIETHQSAITNQKIKEIFDYKISLEQEILLLEKELI